MTEVVVQHVLDVVRDATIGVEMFAAKLKEGIYLPVGAAFAMHDFADLSDFSTKLEANDLVIVSGAPASVNEIQGDVIISNAQLTNALNAWFSAERAAGRLNGGYSVHIEADSVPGESRTVIFFHIPGVAGKFVGWQFTLPKSVNDHLGKFPVNNTQNPASADPAQPHEAVIAGPGHHANEIRIVRSTQIPLRNSFQFSWGAELYDERNTFFDQRDNLPGQLNAWANNPQNLGPKAIMNIDGWLFGVVYTAGSPSQVSRFQPYQTAGTAAGGSILDGDNFRITVDDPRGPLEIRQVVIYEDTFANFVKKVFYSTSTPGEENTSARAWREIVTRAKAMTPEQIRCAIAQLPQSARNRLATIDAVARCTEGPQSKLPPLVVNDAGRPSAGGPDCSVRALAIALALPYDQIRGELDSVHGAPSTEGYDIETVDTVLLRHGWKRARVWRDGKHLHLCDLTHLPRVVAQGTGHTFAMLAGRVHDLELPTDTVRCVVAAWVP